MSNQSYQVDWNYEKLVKQPRSLNFLHTQMRRIFARGSLQMGGRYYGGWWQYIPSQYRPFITINGLPTIEVDYSELHPRFMYWEAGISIPSGDLYDLGLRYQERPVYDKTVEPYKSKRKVIKSYINAIINDDKGRFTLNHEQIQVLGLNTAQLHELVVNKHPLIKNILGQSRGLHYQFLDSQIAEKVMLSLLSKEILCLPVHDSFICQSHHLEVLQAAMSDAYFQLTGQDPKLKDPQRAQTQFESVFYPSGELDLTYMKNKHSNLVHDIFLSTYWSFSKKVT